MGFEYEKTEAAVRTMEGWAADPAHGYDQEYRWGERGDYDCSAAVISAWERAGVPVKTAGATYTGNMRAAFLRCGFRDVTETVSLSSGAGLQRGDVLLNHLRHAALYCGDGQEVEASINEHGGVTGGQPGDQTGREFLIRPYRNFPWDCVLRYAGEKLPGAVDDVEPVRSETAARTVRRGDEGPAVAACQAALREHGFDPTWIDGKFGIRTDTQLRLFQASVRLSPDGVCGKETWKNLLV